ncbi:MAG: NAD(P)H-dependent oxidoreductase subunit E [Spirochaetales bacterium]|nr:NAD(P)H-dependent oxidoreductase subunit E [Spirochaetales bacterium]
MSVENVGEIKFSDSLTAFIMDWKEKPGNLIMILHKVQQEFGFISREAAVKVSEMINTPLAKIYGVATFYHFFKLTKPGKNIIQVCMGTACYLKGGQELLEELGTLLGVAPGEVTDDELFSVESVRCVGCCGLAPVMVIGEDVYGKVLPDQLPEIIAKYRDK